MKKLSAPQISALKRALGSEVNSLITEAHARHNTLQSLVKLGFLHRVGSARRYLRDAGLSMQVYQLTINGLLELEAVMLDAEFKS